MAPAAAAVASRQQAAQRPGATAAGSGSGDVRHGPGSGTEAAVQGAGQRVLLNVRSQSYTPNAPCEYTKMGVDRGQVMHVWFLQCMGNVLTISI